MTEEVNAMNVELKWAIAKSQAKGETVNVNVPSIQEAYSELLPYTAYDTDCEEEEGGALVVYGEANWKLRLHDSMHCVCVRCAVTQWPDGSDVD
jgi:hypothetical protein